MSWRHMSQSPPVIGVLDDEPQLRKALRRLLTSHGFSVQEYERGEDFFAAQSSQRVDCLVLDLHMPGMSGLDVLEAFAARHITMPVVVITGHDEPGLEVRVRALGASSYLKKPVDEAALLSAIKSVITPDNTSPVPR